MFVVEGTLDGQPYTIHVGQINPDIGLVNGTPNILRFLAGREGDEYAATPTGPFGHLSGTAESVLGALLSWTTVKSVRGEAPDILGGSPGPGVRY